MYKVLTIAGSDCSGGAGIQADIKTITAHGMYAMSAVTSLTAQNTTGVYGVFDTTSEFLEKQLECVFSDIMPDSVKIGMVSDKELIKVIAKKIKEYKVSNIVLDPVMVSTSGSKLLKDDAIDALQKELMPIADVITPNLDETAVLIGEKITNVEEMRKAAKELAEKYECSVLVKGGHLDEKATDILYDRGKYYEFTAERVYTENTHGTGCTLSSAIACNIAKGNNLCDSVKNAKEYLTGALKYGLNLGRGNGPVNHCYRIDFK